MSDQSFLCPFPVNENLFLALGKKYSQSEGVVLLHSGKGYDLHKVSYLALFPIHSVIINDEKDPWKELSSQLSFSKQGSSLPKYLGYLSYEMGAFSHLHKRLKVLRKGLPLGAFFKPLILLKWHREDNKLELTMNHCSAEKLSVQASTFLKEADLGIWNALFKETQVGALPFSLKRTSRIAREIYEKQYNQIQKHLQAGDIYQACLTREEIYDLKGDSFDWFSSLAKLRPMPYMAYIKIKEGAIFSLSPERFLKRENRHLIAQPIKGTAKRESGLIADKEAKERLFACKKNGSELVMITDLLRNDLSQVCKFGTVVVPCLKKCEAYPYVWHLASEINGEIKNNVSSIECLQACFPPGSISGCPKIRAQEIITEQENRSRGPYTGAIGYLDSMGNFDFSVAIRTVWVSENKAYVQAGGAILSQSDLDDEWEESVLKMEGITKVEELKC